ncbi:hypothetical protein FB451DRAFT_1187917 [Mycena latifolia]|nr:hypothetical protein FB451DRAFT_1187917 [Mycena latifolia]
MRMEPGVRGFLSVHGTEKAWNGASGEGFPCKKESGVRGGYTRNEVREGYNNNKEDQDEAGDTLTTDPAVWEGLPGHNGVQFDRDIGFYSGSKALQQLYQLGSTGFQQS